MDGLISFASAALSVAADTILKPLRYAKNGVKEIFETIVKELPELPSAAGKLLKGLAKTVDGLWLVGRKLKDSIIKGINTVIDFIVRHATEAYQSVRNKLKKEVTEAATEAATKGVKEVTEDAVENAVIKGASGAILDKKLMEELAESGFKYNADEVLYITKNYEGKLMWLETGNNKSGMQHIMVRHKTDFANKGVTDIQGYLDKALKSKPIEKGMNESGPYAKYLLDGDRYTVAYGSNGYIVSFYPDKMK